MIHFPEIWAIIITHLPRGRWTPIRRIYEIVKRYGNLDTEDFEPQSPASNIPKWKGNTRNVLYYRKSTGQLRWDRNARYLLP
jgi:hypothetical protein